jgi:hypothetical protein
MSSGCRATARRLPPAALLLAALALLIAAPLAGACPLAQRRAAETSLCSKSDTCRTNAPHVTDCLSFSLPGVVQAEGYLTGANGTGALWLADTAARAADARPFREVPSFFPVVSLFCPSARRPAAYLDSTPGNIGSAADIYMVRARPRAQRPVCSHHLPHTNSSIAVRFPGPSTG